MTKYEGPFQGVDNNSAGCSTESSSVDSLLDDQGELLLRKLFVLGRAIIKGNY